MSDLTPREVIDRIARGLELTRQEFTKPSPDARRPALVMVKRKKSWPQSSRNARSVGRTVRRSRPVVPNRGRQATRALAANKSLAADKVLERLLHSLREQREALAIREHAESVAQSRRSIYLVLAFATGVIAGALMMKYLWPIIQA